jgi:hypothetical protein
MAGVTKSHIQIGDSATDTNNFMITAQAANGTMKIARGNNGATTQDILTVDATGNVQLTKTTAQSMVRVNTPNGYGSSSTKVRRFSNITSGTNGCVVRGTDITAADSASAGASFTINVAGVYAISYSDCFNATGTIGLSLNTTNGATIIYSLPIAEILICNTIAALSYMGNACWTGFLAAGDVIRPHGEGTATGGNVNGVQFTIARVS